MSVATILDGIEKGRIVLPAIQRDFVWSSERIERLFDSLFRGYPVGVVLLWDTNESIQYRKFGSQYHHGAQPEYLVNKGETIQLVLDGQQRLTSLYIGLRGSLNGKLLHFDVLSGRSTDDASEEKFSFQFMTAVEAAEKNNTSLSQPGDKPVYFVALKDFSSSNKPGPALRTQLMNAFDLTATDEERIWRNFELPRSVLIDPQGLLQEQIIDQGLPPLDASRKSVFDILEIFMRINTQGINLTRSDLILSMLRLHWQDATDKLPKFISSINSNSSIEVDSDFVIRCIFSVAGLGTRLDINLLRKPANVSLVKDAYTRTTDAIRSTIDFVRKDCGIGSVKLLNGLNTLVPIVHYLAAKPKPVVEDSERQALRRAIFLLAFSGVLTKHSDSRPGALIQAISGEKGDALYTRVLNFVKSKTRLEKADALLFGNNVPLALAVVQGHDDGQVLYNRNLPEIDHIFPRAKYGDDPLINDIGNLWFLPQHVNRNKKDAEPKVYLKAVEDATLEAALIDRTDLGKRFPQFVRARRKKMVEIIRRRSGVETL